MNIKKNLGTGDRIVRLVFAGIVLLLFFLRVIGGPLAAALLVLSFILVLTVLFSFCPVYRLFGIDNNHAKPANEDL